MTDRDWTIVIPVKPASIGKSRLDVADVDRGRLARAIALDTIAAAASCERVDRVVVVTGDDALASAVGRTPRVTVLPEDTPHGLDAAIAAGIRAAGDGRRGVLLGDLPALTAAALAEALAAASEVDHAVVPDADGTGSTLVTAAAGVEWTSSFGDGSFARHVALGCIPLDASAPLRRDVDTLDQLRDAERLGLGPATAAALPQKVDAA